MILIDTSVWIDHLRNNNSTLVRLLEQSRALMHPMVLWANWLAAITDICGFGRSHNIVDPR